MQLGSRPTAPPPSTDLATALRAATASLGHRPAITVRGTDRRDEQGYASLAQWASKTAHWLQIEHLLEPGDTVDLVSPPGWPAVALMLGAWWAGVTVNVGDSGAELAVAHESADLASLTAHDVVLTGDAVDGSPTVATDLEPFAIAVQAFPDQPPAPRAEPDTTAVVIDGRAWSHEELLATARELGTEGAAGLSIEADTTLWVPALAVRPLVSGQPTVLLAGTTREAAEGERVRTWLDG